MVPGGLTKGLTDPLQDLSCCSLGGAEVGARQIDSFTHSEFMLYAPGPGLVATTRSKRFDLLVNALPPCDVRHTQ